ncbi:MAG: molybdenum cofactor biosynthesis protein MoaE [Sphingobium sp.]
MIRVAVQAGGFDPATELAALEALGGGGIASFTGIVRADGGLSALHLDHYPAMTLAQMERIAAEAAGRWPLLGITLIHRFGTLPVGERIVFVGTASESRAPALEACAFLIDWLKVAAPFWKREVHPDGSGEWVEARGLDDERASRWS